MKLFQVLKLTVPNSRGSAIEIQTIYLGDNSDTAIARMETAKQEESGNGVSYLIQSVNAEVKEGVAFSDMILKPTEVKWKWSGDGSPTPGERIRCRVAGGEYIVGIYEDWCTGRNIIRDDENGLHDFDKEWCYESEFQGALQAALKKM